MTMHRFNVSTPRRSSATCFNLPARHAIEQLEQRVLMAANPLSAQNNLGVTVFTAVGTANVAAAQAAFEKAIGGVNNGANPPEQTSGFRDINWDGVLLDGTDFGGKTITIVPNKVVGIPINRFQARGAEFDEVYAVSGDGFASVNPGAAGLLNPFTPKNIFGHFGDTDLGMEFVTPALPTTSPVQQATRGFSAVFLNVEKAHTSNIEFENGSNSLGTFYAPAGAKGQPEFLGVLYSAPVVTHVDVNPGTAAIFDFQNKKVTPGPADIAKGGTANIAAVDNFDYAEPAKPVSANVIHASEGSTFSNTVTTFADSTKGITAASLSATISWGDGTSSAGVISGTAPNFTVKGTHVFKEQGTYPVSIKIADKSGDSALSSAVADVADAPLKLTGLTLQASTKTPFVGNVARLVDGNALNTNPAEYTGLINWGDGHATTASFVLTSAGNWLVQGTHKYAAEGSFTIIITITDTGGSGTAGMSSIKVD